MDCFARSAMTRDEPLRIRRGQDSGKVSRPGIDKIGRMSENTAIRALPAGGFFNNNPNRAFPHSPRSFKT
jgi:hypothetical protein